MIDNHKFNPNIEKYVEKSKDGMDRYMYKVKNKSKRRKT